jgi:hypothetical protein
LRWWLATVLVDFAHSLTRRETGNDAPWLSEFAAAYLKAHQKEGRKYEESICYLPRRPARLMRTGAHESNRKQLSGVYSGVQGLSRSARTERLRGASVGDGSRRARVSKPSFCHHQSPGHNQRQHAEQMTWAIKL